MGFFFILQTVAEMEGVTAGIRPEGYKKVKVVEPPTPEPEPQSFKLRLKAKYGDKPAAKPKKLTQVKRKDHKDDYQHLCT